MRAPLIRKSLAGRGGSMHLFDAAACFFGEGAVAEGVFHETMNQAPLFVEYQTYRFRAHSMFDAEVGREVLQAVDFAEAGTWEPVLILEHALLYNTESELGDDPAAGTDIAHARVRRAGRDVSLVAEPGETIPVGAVMATLLEPGETPEEDYGKLTSVNGIVAYLDSRLRG